MVQLSNFNVTANQNAAIWAGPDTARYKSMPMFDVAVDAATGEKIYVATEGNCLMMVNGSLVRFNISRSWVSLTAEQIFEAFESHSTVIHWSYVEKNEKTGVQYQVPQRAFVVSAETAQELGIEFCTMNRFNSNAVRTGFWQGVFSITANAWEHVLLDTGFYTSTAPVYENGGLTNVAAVQHHRNLIECVSAIRASNAVPTKTIPGGDGRPASTVPVLWSAAEQVAASAAAQRAAGDDQVRAQLAGSPLQSMMFG